MTFDLPPFQSAHSFALVVINSVQCRKLGLEVFSQKTLRMALVALRV